MATKTDEHGRMVMTFHHAGDHHQAHVEEREGADHLVVQNTSRGGAARWLPIDGPDARGLVAQHQELRDLLHSEGLDVEDD
jgi:hypothetical protein